MCIDSKNQITQTIPIAQLTIHHTQQLVPAGEMPKKDAREDLITAGKLGDKRGLEYINKHYCPTKI